MAGWKDSDRRVRLPDNWAELVKAVRRRDQGQCTWRLKSGKRCPRPGTDVDHVKPGDDHRLTNLRLLCEHHHDLKSSFEGHAAKAAKKKRRPPEAHPGLVR